MKEPELYVKHVSTLSPEQAKLSIHRVLSSTRTQALVSVSDLRTWSTRPVIYVVVVVTALCVDFTMPVEVPGL